MDQAVLERLLLSRALLDGIRFPSVADPDRLFVAKQIITAHDAAELALAAIGQHLNASPAKDKCYLMDYFEPMRELYPGEDVPGRSYFSQLNRVRVDIKHLGIFPDPKQWARTGERVWEYVEQWCTGYLGISFADLDRSALLKSPEVKMYFASAKEALAGGDYQRVLERISFALQVLFKENRALYGLKVGVPRTEDAIRLTRFGVHANDFLELQNFMPEVAEEAGGLKYRWRQGKFGHPGNWEQRAAQFCCEAFLDLAVKIQDAPFIPTALEFSSLYEYKITAKSEGVEVWTDVVQSESAWERVWGFGPRKREVVKVLGRGEAVQGYLWRLEGEEYADPDATESGVRVSALKFCGPPTGGSTWYVKAEQVAVTCIPRDDPFVAKYFPGLPEQEWLPGEPPWMAAQS